MQNKNVLRKWTDLRGLAAVSIDTGKKEGTIDDFYFDTSTNMVVAFLIKISLFSHRVLPFEAVNAVGIDAITFPSDEALIKEGSDPKLKSASSGRALLTYRVLSEGGNLIGNIGNILLDTSTATMVNIASFELAAGLRAHLSGQYPSFLASQVTRYGEDVLVIPDVVAEELSK